MTSRLRSALLTGAVAATLAFGAAPAQADNQQDPPGLPAAEKTAPAPAADLVATDLEPAPSTEPVAATEIVPAESAPAPVEAEELLADAVMPVLVEETETDDDGGTLTGAAEESSEDVDGGDGGFVDPLEDDAVDAPDGGVGEDQAPDAGSEPAPDVEPGTPAAPTPSAPQPPVPAGFESIVVGGRTLTHADFNIPDDIAASDEATVALWMEENMDLVLESEGMIYLVDLMLGYLEAGDFEGLAGLIREMSVSDPAAGEELILWMYELFAGFEEWPAEFGEDHIYVGAPSPYEITPASTSAPTAAPAPAVQPASAKAGPAAQSVPEAVETAAAPLAAPAGVLAETGAAGAVWLASGGAGLLLLGVALVALRRRMA